MFRSLFIASTSSMGLVGCCRMDYFKFLVAAMILSATVISGMVTAWWRIL